ncbi:serine/threonine-protein kinase [Aquisphaera insulae]|uniref:serine/threonine-protein kinase n=1 Tax=Aquisphaera insulae TaxID=2712864 RepID=UPI0013ED250A|nr:serine/threonine-protein kinase [Aquisphaera insulae]
MSSLPTPPGDPGELASVVSDVKRLEDQWQFHGDVGLEKFWQECRSASKGRACDPMVHLGALIKADMRCRFERGQQPEVTEYLDRFPGLDAADSRVISLIYEEYCLLKEGGEDPDVDDFRRRYPRWSDSFASQLRYHRIFSQAGMLKTSEPKYPKPGDHFDDVFRLDALIGKGGSSRVYLASDLSLGGKRVVLKVSRDNGQEPKTQGILDHPHIVPVNSVVYESADGLRGLAMPYRPGLPLDDLLRRLRSRGRPARALTFWEALVEGLPADLPSLGEEERGKLRRQGPVAEGWRGFPIDGTFAEGAAWLAMILARALHYAHEMKTYHRDVKPGNVLVTLQHGPQLLDFNLADSPYVADHAEYAMLGGTLPYMAPEQIRAFLNPQHWDQVGARSDIYSLGLVLREVLTGLAPKLPNEKVPLAKAMNDLLEHRHLLDSGVRRANPDVPHGLQAIVAKCLEFELDDRYPDALALADDLEAFLDRRPLRGAVNPSRRERLQNWASRNRTKIAINGVYLSILSGLGIAAAAAWLKPDPSTLPQFTRAVRNIHAGRADDAVEPLRALVREYPLSSKPRAYLGLAQALSTRLTENDAQVSLREFFAMPDADQILRELAREDPALPDRLTVFANQQIEHLNIDKMRRYDEKSAAAKAALMAVDREVEKRYYQVLRRILNVALEARPDSTTIPPMMAAAEEALGDYQAALDRVERLIERMRGRLERSQRDDFIRLISQRARVAWRLAQGHYGRGDRASLDRGIALIQRSLDDMKSCEAEIFEVTNTEDDPHARATLVYSHYWLQTECWLTLADIQERAGARPESASSRQKARTSYNRLRGFVAQGSLKVTPELNEMGERVRKGMIAARGGS